MKKLKDFIYDYNDIVLALIIIVVAGAVIFWKTTDIMAYPAYAKAQQQEQQQGTEVDITDEDLQKIDVDPIVSAGEDLEGQAQQTEDTQTTPVQSTTPQTNTAEDQKYTVTKDTTFTVPSGYVSSKIASKLESEGLCKATDFTSAVEKLDAEKKLRAGDFKIPAGSTAEDIVKIIANIK